MKRAPHVATSYQARSRPEFSGGYIMLEWGTETGYGHRHIRYRHQADWANKMPPLRGHWDDFTDFATRQSLAAPSTSVDQGGGGCATPPRYRFGTPAGPC